MCCTKNWMVFFFFFIKIHFRIISHLQLGLPNALLFFQFTHQNPVYMSVLPHTCYLSHPSQSSWVNHLNNIWWAVQSWSSLLCSFLQSCYLIPLGPNDLSQNPQLEHPQPMSSFTPVQNNGKNYSASYFNLAYFWTANRKTRFCSEWQQAFSEFNLLLISSWAQLWFVTCSGVFCHTFKRFITYCMLVSRPNIYLVSSAFTSIPSRS